MELLKESEQNQNPEALPYFAQAYEVLSLDQWLDRNEPESIARLKELGEID
jgi:hypothetical protein